MLTLLFTFLLSSLPSLAKPGEVLLLRHGEKPEQGDGLSPQGWARAKALPEFFQRSELKALGVPAVLFAQKPQPDGKQSRPFQTLQFVAGNFGQAINVDFTRDNVEGLTHEILQNPAYNGKLVVVCWEHKVLGEIASALGVKPQPNYPGQAFDRAWLLTYTADDSNLPHFDDLPEHLLPGDSAK